MAEISTSKLTSKKGFLKTPRGHFLVSLIKRNPSKGSSMSSHTHQMVWNQDFRFLQCQKMCKKTCFYCFQNGKSNFESATSRFPHSWDQSPQHVLQKHLKSPYLAPISFSKKYCGFQKYLMKFKHFLCRFPHTTSKCAIFSFSDLKIAIWMTFFDFPKMGVRTPCDVN